MIRLTMVLTVGLGVLLLAGGCSGGKSACDCKPTIDFTSPTGSNALTEFDDLDPNTPGIQYPVSVVTTCIKNGQKLGFTNDKNPGGNVEGTVVIDDQATGTGHIDFGNQTFLEGTNHVCVTGTIQVGYKTSGSSSCSIKDQTIESCKDIVVTLNVPACRFVNPTDGAILVETEDSDLGLAGFQSNVQVVCKAVNDGTAITLTVNNGAPLSTTLANSKAAWNDTTLVEGSDVLHVETTGNDNSTVVAEISVTLNGDVVAPCAINDLTAALDTPPAASRHADVKLNWTAVGNDCNTGTATAYLLRWSLSPIATESDWSAATAIDVSSVVPQAAGTAETFLATKLPPLNTYHFVIRAVDEAGNVGPIPTSDVSLVNMWNLVAPTGPGGSFGEDLWNIGDVNNDGIDDLAVSAYDYNSYDGALYIFFGTSDLSAWALPATPQLLTIPGSAEYFGFYAQGRGDVDGDGITDLIVGGFAFNNQTGRVHIFFGRDHEFLPSTSDVEIRGDVAGGRFGYDLRIIGDINKDGINDIFIAEHNASGHQGRGYIFFGRTREKWAALATGNDNGNNYVPAANADVIFLGNAAGDRFGYRFGATSLGDINGDGYGDFALPACAVNKEYIFSGATISATNTTGQPSAVFLDPEDTSLETLHEGDTVPPGSFLLGLGAYAVGGKDFTGDGVPDLVVASPAYNEVFLFASANNSISSVPLKTITGQLTNLNFGWGIDAADINMDGHQDIILGTNPDFTYGYAFIFLNTGTGQYFNDVADIILSRDFFGVNYPGFGVALGDFNGDGLPDVVLGTFVENTFFVLY